MEIVNGKLVLGTHDCSCINHPAGRGKTWNIKWCENRTKARGLHSCEKKTCPNNPKGTYGMHEISREVVTCHTCKGTCIVPDGICDSITIPETMPVLVFRQNRANTWNESNLGMNCVYSCQDYGRSFAASDEAVIADVRAHKSTQAIKIIRKDDLTVCDALAVYVTRNGYSVRQFWNETGEKQFSGVDGRAVGMAVYNAGGNGTLAAALAE